MSVKDDEGIAAVFLANRSVLERFLRARLDDPNEAEDVLQDIWLKLEGLNTGPISDPLAYLFRMAQNAALDRRRSKTQRIKRERQWVDTQHTKSGSDYIEDLPSAEQRLLDRERLQGIERILDGLHENTSYAFRAFRVERRAQREIAADLGVSLSTVEKHLQKAYKAILEYRKDTETDDQ